MAVTGQILVATEAAHTVLFWSTDKAGNKENPQELVVDMT